MILRPVLRSRRAAHVAFAGLAALLVTLAPLASASAQDGGGGDSPTPNGSLVTNGVISPAALETQIVRVLTAVDDKQRAPQNLAPESLPQAPIASPQVGPLIKEYYADIVDRRTTAFVPEDWDSLNLSPIPGEIPDENWVHVDLSEQILVAYTGATPVRAFVIASGLPGTPTVTGEFRVRTKVRSQTMSGGEGAYYYNLPNVQWVQYFYEDYGLHGTYWHNSFGTPRSHGCVNMTNADAKWVWEFLGPVWDGHTVWYKSTEENPGGVVIVTE